MFVVVASLLERSRARAIDDLRRDTRNLTAALALYTGGVVTNIDLALVGARDSLALLELTERGQVRGDLGNEVLRDNVARIGLPVVMRLVDAEGYQIFSSDGLVHPDRLLELPHCTSVKFSGAGARQPSSAIGMWLFGSGGSKRCRVVLSGSTSRRVAIDMTRSTSNGTPLRQQRTATRRSS